MNIQIDGTCPVPVLNVIDFMLQIRAWYPDLKIKDSNNMDDIKRVIKKMIKERSVFLDVHFLFFNANIPLLLYNDLNRLLGKKICKLENLDLDNLSFESNSKFTSKEELILTNLFKKVKSSLKELEIPSWDNMLYILPGSTIANTTVMLSYIEVFKLLTITSKYPNTKLYDFGNLLFKTLSERFPEMFNDYNIEIYLATKEIL